MSRLRKSLGRWLGKVLAGALLLGASMPGAVAQETAPPEAPIADGRPILVASQEAIFSLETARGWLRVGYPEFRDALDDAHRSIAHARAAFHDATWPKELRRTRRGVAQRLFMADRALIRSEMPKFASRRGMIDRLASLATRQLAQAAVTLETLVPPEPPPLEPEEPAPGPQDPPAPQPDPVPTPPTGPAAFEWTDFAPSADTRMVYVSSSEGADSNDGLSETTPVRTISKGFTLLRDGYPDWLRLKKGDTWTIGAGVDGFGNPPASAEHTIPFTKSGRSATERMVVGSYGTGDRPYLKCNPNQPAIWTQDPPVKHVAFTGMNFKAYTRDPTSTEYTGTDGYNATTFLYTTDVLIEDCRFSYFMGFIVQASTDFTLRGSVVSDCYALVNHSGGLYSYDVKGLVVESCFFIRNGWCPGVAGAEATVFNRNLYISHSPGAVVRDTLDADGASGGMQLRLGGRCERNLFVRTPMAIGYGHGENPEGSTTTGVISQNVILGGRDITKLPMATGITVGTSSVGVEVSENIITHNTEGTGNVAGIALIGEDTETAGGIDIHHNIIHDWQYQGSGYGFVFFQSGTRNLRLRNVTIHDNVVQQSGDASLIGTEATAGLSGATFSANTYHTPRSAGAWFKLAGEFYDWDAWKGLTGDTSTDRTAKSFPDANRDVLSYMQSIGQTATIDEFLRLAREQSKDAWMPQITARAVIDYVREGFGLAPIATSE